MMKKKNNRPYSQPQEEESGHAYYKFLHTQTFSTASQVIPITTGNTIIPMCQKTVKKAGKTIKKLILSGTRHAYPVKDRLTEK